METFDCADCHVRHLTLYGRIPTRDLGRISEVRRRTWSVTRRGLVLRRGEDPRSYYVLRKGWAFRYLITPHGFRQILWFNLPGEALTPLLEGKSAYSVEALTTCDLCILDPDFVLRYATGSNENVRRLLHSLCASQQACYERIAALGQLTATERVAYLLRHLQVRLALRGHAVEEAFEFPLRNAHVADALGMTPVHVSRVFRDLREQGVVERQERRVQVLNQDLLNELARVSADRQLATPID